MTNALEKIFRQAGAVLDGHFLLASGLHSPIYWEKFQVLQYPAYTQQLCQLIADHYRPHKIELVVGPTTGGVILAFETARQLGVRGIFAEKVGNGQRAFKRGFTVNPRERVLIVDDILTTGGSVREVMAAVNELGGLIVGIGVLVDRSPHRMDFGVSLFSCLRSQTIVYPPEDCPLCAADIPLVRPGSKQC